MLTKAGKQYLSCCAAVSHLDVHAPFFEALAASPSPVPVHHFAMSLITTLRANRRNNDNISYAIFHLVLRCRNRLSDDVKEQLLHVVSANIAGRTNVSPSVDNGLAEVVASDPDVLIAALEIALFTPGDIAAGDPITRWSTTVASRLFAPDSTVQTTVEVRWHCIILLALARTRSTDGAGQAVAQAYDPVQQAAVVEWRTVCVLATLDNFFRSAESHGSALENDVIQGFSQLVRKLWKEWSSVHPSVAPPRPLLVARIICASFMRLGGQLKDKALVEVCRDFCVATGLWSVRETQPATEAGLQLLAAEQLYASLVCGTFFERALVDLMVYTYDLRILRSAVDSAIVRYLQRDPEHAQELAAWATSRAVPPSDTVVADVGVALAKHGVSGFLDRYLDDTRLAPELRAKVALAHLRMYMRHGRRFVNPAELIEKMDTFVLLATQLEKPHSFLAVFRGALLVLVRHQYAPQVVKIVQDASAKHPLWFSELFYTHLLRVLLDHRQFRLAQRTLSVCSSRHPENAERWTSLVLFKLHRVRAKKLLFKHLGRRMSRNALLALARTRSGRLEQPKVPVNTASSTWTVDSHTWHQTVHALVKRGGFVAAKQLFDAVRQRASSHAQTVIGNTILHGYVLRRRSSNHRRLEMVLDTFKQFKEQYDFAPDHVTVNIMLKAQLRSTEDMDARMARQLFDVLVRSGYPTGMSAAPPARGIDTPPFGMDPSPVETVIVGKLEIPRIQAPLWYRSHVKPLYKTFVKAFYLRGDVAAARKVVGIMKILEAQGWRRGRRV